VLANQRRGQQRQGALVERLAGAAAAAPEPANDGALAAAFTQLRQNDREVLMLVAWDGLDGTRAARALGCSRGAFAVRLHRARRRLATALEAVESIPGTPALKEER
jgi:RNA polymerase sigma-70 factor (ECF subfamily)